MSSVPAGSSHPLNDMPEPSVNVPPFTNTLPVTFPASNVVAVALLVTVRLDVVSCPERERIAIGQIDVWHGE